MREALLADYSVPGDHLCPSTPLDELVATQPQPSSAFDTSWCHELPPSSRMLRGSAGGRHRPELPMCARGDGLLLRRSAHAAQRALSGPRRPPQKRSLVRDFGSPLAPAFVDSREARHTRRLECHPCLAPTPSTNRAATGARAPSGSRGRQRDRGRPAGGSRRRSCLSSSCRASRLLERLPRRIAR